MNKSELKNFAIRARLSLRERVQARAALYGVTPAACANKTIASSADFRRLDGGVLTGREIRQRAALIARVTQIGYESAMEEAAYTWFNRIVAIKYLQEHNLLPLPLRALPDAPGETPQLLRQAQDVTLPGVDPDTVLQLLDQNRADELYKYLLIALCNALAEPLPGMFETIREECDLLFPDSLLKEDSVLGELARLEPDSWQEIQVIGWLYQYYNTQLKDETFELLKKNVKITRERIGAATQLFTPEWIVRYMVENSLGRLWLEVHPDENLRMKWRYFMDEAPQTPEVTEKLRAIRTPCAGLQPEQLTVLDPCMGSGHILVYAFDVLMDIYRSVGYTDRDAARSILEHNLCGLDIDDRAAQLAYFAVMMKACEYDRRFLRRGVQPHVCAVQESAPLDSAALSALGPERPLAEKLLQTFADGKEYGSLLQPELTEGELTALENRLNTLETGAQETLLTLADSAQAAEALRPLLRQARLLARKYHAVITNPPYMGGSGMNDKLSRFVKEHYPDSKSDLFATFIEQGLHLVQENGFTSMITMESWMFLSSFEKLRTSLLQKTNIVTMVHMPYLGKGGTSLGINFGTAATVLRKGHVHGYIAAFDRISYYETDTEGVPFTFPVENEYFKHTNTDNFSKIPGAPVAYWVSEAFFANFTGNAIKNVCTKKTRISTGDNERFMRKWFEVSNVKIYDPNKWIPCPKGGDYRKWFGNIDVVLNWENEGADLQAFPRAMLGDSSFFMKPGLTWTVISSAKTSFRIVPQGCICDHKGPLIYFFDRSLENYVLALLNSIYSEKILEITAPTIGFEWGAIAKIPWKETIIEDNRICALVQFNVNISKADWDSFETSLNFKKHSMI